MTTAEAWAAYEAANLRARMAYRGTYQQPKKCERCGQPNDRDATECADCAVKHSERMRAYRERRKK